MPDNAAFGTTAVVRFDGAELPPWASPLLERVVVDDHVHLPDMVALTFRDQERDLLQRLRLSLGLRIEVTAMPTGGASQEPLIIAEVTGFEHESSPAGSHATVLGYDPSHRLCRARRTRSWTDVTDSDIARQLAAEGGIPIGKVEATGLVHRHVSQISATDWDFLKGRAQETGYEVTVLAGKLEWRRPADHGDAPTPADALATSPRLQLVVGTNLLRFRPRVTSHSQVRTVEARGWDPVMKKALVSSVPAKTSSADITMPHGVVVGAFPGQAFYPVVDRALSRQAEVEAVARSVAEQMSSAFVEADGEAHGDPRLVAGAAVAVSMAGWPHDGTYTLTSTRHIFDSRGYRTNFTCSGRQERSMLGLMTLGATKGSQSAGGPPVYGVVVGIVTDVKDPEQMGRVRLKLPWLSDAYVTGWARVAQLGAGTGRGAAFLPEVDDEVLVAFDRGDTRVPYVVGQLYNGKDKPKHAGELVDSSSGKVAKRVIASRTGHELVFDEEKGVRLSTGDGRAVVTIDSGGTITITGTSTIQIKGDANVEVSAKTKLTLTGGAELELSAPQIKVAASAQLDLGSSGVAKLHGSIVQIN